MNRTLKIAFTGTHGTGKTTSVYQLASALKLERGLPNVGIACELGRMCPYPVNLETSQEAQLWLTNMLTIKEMELQRTHPILICDRTVVDAVAYTKSALNRSLQREDSDFERNTWKDLYDASFHLADYWIRTYDVIIFKRACLFNFQHNDGQRDMHSDFRDEIDGHLMTLYKELLLDRPNYYNFKPRLINLDETMLGDCISDMINLANSIFK